MASIFMTLTVAAQEWVYVGDQYENDHVVYATFDGITASDASNYELGAFIEGECRAIAALESISAEDGTTGTTGTSVVCFRLRVKGEADDNGKTVVLKVRKPGSFATAPTPSLVYSLSQSFKYVHGTSGISGTTLTGIPSNLYKVTFKPATKYSYTCGTDDPTTEVDDRIIKLNTGATATITYKADADGQLPDDFDKYFSAAGSEYFTISGTTITANNENKYGRGEIKNTLSGLTATNQLWVEVIENIVYATGITVNFADKTLTAGEEYSFKESDITITPADATNKSFAIASDKPECVVPVTNAANVVTGFKAVAAGTATITVTALGADPTKSVKTTFKVTVLPKLTGLKLNETNIVMSSQTIKVITVSPEPTTAIIPAGSITANVTGTAAAEAWKFVTTSVADKSITLTAFSMGYGTLNVSVGSISATAPITVGFEYDLANDWNWMSVFTQQAATAAAGPVIADGIKDIFGNSLVEARTQKQLLYNDPVYGYFGDFTDFVPNTNECYKIKYNGEKTTYMRYGNYIATGKLDISLGEGWTWIPYPYEYDYTPAQVISNAKEGDKVLSLTDGFATYTSGAWTSSFTMKGGQGYLYYSTDGGAIQLASPTSLPQPASISPASTKARVQRYWNYNPHQFSNVTPVIATIDGYNSDEFSVGAFVGDECRGEGRFVDGLWLISVSGNGDENVNFRVLNKITGHIFPITNTVKMTSVVGTAKEPVMLNASDVTDINSITSGSDADGAYYNLKGQKVNNAHKGIFIRNGRKVVIK